MNKTISVTKNTYGTNAVKAATLRKYQASVLEELSSILQNSFGPNGSNTLIKKDNGPNMYTKDGHTILCNTMFTGIIEESIRYDIETITKNIADTVGDGTTSAVILSKLIFNGIVDKMDDDLKNVPPAVIVRSLNQVVEVVADAIRENATPAETVDIYDIAMVSANGDVDIANMIADIYDESGLGVFIDVAMTTAKDTTIKYYNGMTLNTGFADIAFVTNTADNTAVVDNPAIYFFEDPIDTKEMGILFDAIVSNNIMAPIQSKMYDAIIPTVILAPRMSRDMSSVMDSLVAIQAKQPTGNKLPIVVISNTHQITELKDICDMCGAKGIRKYIDPEIQAADIEAGLAPTVENVAGWGAGSAGSVIAGTTKTKFIDPIYTKTGEDGTHTQEFQSLLDYLETSIASAIADGDDARTIGTFRRRLNSLKSNLVEIYAGGITTADRDSARHLIEDAVKNCRSAAAFGVGNAANFSGLQALTEMQPLTDTVDNTLLEILKDAYKELSYILYTSVLFDEDEATLKVAHSLDLGCAMNLRTGAFDGSAKSSIESDIIIMESIAKILGIMVTCNQFLTPSPVHNVYSDLTEV